MTRHAMPRLAIAAPTSNAPITPVKSGSEIAGPSMLGRVVFCSSISAY
jgi:hypothetical protein